MKGLEIPNSEEIKISSKHILPYIEGWLAIQRVEDIHKNNKDTDRDAGIVKSWFRRLFNKIPKIQ
jgi:hypothetical protein